MGSMLDLNGGEWKTVRPDVAEGVLGKTLLDKGVKAVVTRVAPGGRMGMHRDSYGHLLYFLGGTGLVGVGDDRYDVRPGISVSIAAGEEHFYHNTGIDDLTLISFNIPENSE